MNTLPYMALVALLTSGMVSGGEVETAGSREKAKQIVAARCAKCHGLTGNSVSNDFPKLSGQHAEYIVKQLFSFKTGQRPSTVMAQMADDLTATDIYALARYFSEQKMQRSRMEDPELGAVGRYIYFKGNPYSKVAACATCHGVNGSGEAQLPRIAGQHAAYIETRLKSLMQPGRRDARAAMHMVIAPITELEMKAVAQYISATD